MTEPFGLATSLKSVSRSRATAWIEQDGSGERPVLLVKVAAAAAARLANFNETRRFH